MEKAPFQKSDSKSTALGPLPAVGTPICVEIHLSSARLLLAGENHGEEKTSLKETPAVLLLPELINGKFEDFSICGRFMEIVDHLLFCRPTWNLFSLEISISLSNRREKYKSSTALGRTK